MIAALLLVEKAIEVGALVIADLEIDNPETAIRIAKCAVYDTIY